MGRINLILSVFAFMLLAGGIFAIGNASTSTASNTRWASGAAGSEGIEGGNISQVNITSTTLTERWAAFSGNITGSINLTDGTASVYSWSWTPTSGGEVCVSTNDSFDFSDTANAAAADVNTAWSFGSATDNATETYNNTGCSLTFIEGSAANTAYATLQGSSTFDSCVINNGNNAAETDFAFCTSMNTTGKNFRNDDAHYELLVPTSSGAGDTEVYYFYVELN